MIKQNKYFKVEVIDNCCWIDDKLTKTSIYLTRIQAKDLGKMLILCTKTSEA